jgi:hypothetical protein
MEDLERANMRQNAAMEALASGLVKKTTSMHNRLQRLMNEVTELYRGAVASGENGAAQDLALMHMYLCQAETRLDSVQRYAQSLED